MFIPLNSVDENDWPNILLAGDTASVFYLLGLLSAFKLNIYVADTGVAGRSPLQFRSGRGNRRDLAGAYYDFFDAPCRIGSGVLRRFDLLIHTTSDRYLQEWARLLRVPSAVLTFPGPDRVSVDLEGARPDSGCLAGCHDLDGALSAVLLAFVEAAAKDRYKGTVTRLTADMHGTLYVSPPAPVKLPRMAVPLETKYSAWDYAGDLLKAGETPVVYADSETQLVISPGAGDVRMVELGVPELHILRYKGLEEKYVELTGDLPRVFDKEP